MQGCTPSARRWHTAVPGTAYDVVSGAPPLVPNKRKIPGGPGDRVPWQVIPKNFFTRKRSTLN